MKRVFAGMLLAAALGCSSKSGGPQGAADAATDATGVLGRRRRERRPDLRVRVPAGHEQRGGGRAVAADDVSNGRRRGLVRGVRG